MNLNEKKMEIYNHVDEFQVGSLYMYAYPFINRTHGPVLFLGKVFIKSLEPFGYTLMFLTMQLEKMYFYCDQKHDFSLYEKCNG